MWRRDGLVALMASEMKFWMWDWEGLFCWGWVWWVGSGSSSGVDDSEVAWGRTVGSGTLIVGSGGEVGELGSDSLDEDILSWVVCVRLFSVEAQDRA